MGWDGPLGWVRKVKNQLPRGGCDQASALDYCAGTHVPDVDPYGDGTPVPDAELSRQAPPPPAPALPVTIGKIKVVVSPSAAEDPTSLAFPFRSGGVVQDPLGSSDHLSLIRASEADSSWPSIAMMPSQEWQPATLEGGDVGCEGARVRGPGPCHSCTLAPFPLLPSESRMIVQYNDAPDQYGPIGRCPARSSVPYRPCPCLPRSPHRNRCRQEGLVRASYWRSWPRSTPRSPTG